MEEDIVIDEMSGNLLETLRDMNYELHAQGLYMPLLDGFQKLESDDPQVLLLAEKDGCIEQVTSDGYCEEGTFDKRIEAVIKSTKDFMKECGCEDIDNSFRFYKDYNNEVFNYKVYVCDMIIPIKGANLITRQFIAYFVEPVMNDFYQITLSSAPVNMPPEEIILGKIDLENDKVTKELNGLMDKILNDFEYHKD